MLLPKKSIQLRGVFHSFWDHLHETLSHLHVNYFFTYRKRTIWNIKLYMKIFYLIVFNTLFLFLYCKIFKTKILFREKDSSKASATSNKTHRKPQRARLSSISKNNYEPCLINNVFHFSNFAQWLYNFKNIPRSLIKVILNLK